MCTRWKHTTDRNISVAAVARAAALMILVRRGCAFQTSNMFTAVRRATSTLAGIGGSSTSSTSSTMLPRATRIPIIHRRQHIFPLSMMAWEDREVPRGDGGRRERDRGFSTGGVVDEGFTGDSDDYASRGRSRDGDDRGADSFGNRGSGGGGRQRGYSSGRSGRGRGGAGAGAGAGSRHSTARGNRDRGAGSWGGGRNRGGSQYEQRDGRTGGGREWEADEGSRGGRVEHGAGYGGRRDDDFGDNRRSNNWEDRGGRGGRGAGRDNGGSGGRRGQRGAGRGLHRADGPSRPWTPQSGSGGDDAQTWGRGRGGRGRGGRGGGRVEPYRDADGGGYEEGEDDNEEGVEEGGTVAGSPASDWMRGALSTYHGELAPDAEKDEDTDFDMVYGIAPVLNALRNTRREKLGLYCQDGLAPANKKDRAAANTIYDLARDSDVLMTTTDKGYLNTLCGNRPHQGFILKARPLEFEPILFLPRIDAAGATDSTQQSEEQSAEDEEGKGATAAPIGAAPGQVWLALDEVTDPQNFGALLRSAHFFGASGVVTCAKNSASLTATVSKSSAGAVEVMRVHSTANMMRFLKRSKENGWRVVGTSVSERSVTLHDLPAGPDAPPTIVVLGNEGYGVRANVLRECEFLVEVAGGGGGALAEGAASSTVDSLNVSVTGGVMLFYLLAGAKHAAANAPKAVAPSATSE